MRSRGALLILLGTIAVLIAGVAVLFQRRLAQGDVFPPYSSLRADPLGTRAFHDALAELPALHVERWHARLGDLEPTPPPLLIHAGWKLGSWSRLRREDFDAIEAAVRGGSRLVVTLRGEMGAEPTEQPAPEGAKRSTKDGKKKTRTAPPVAYADLRGRWGANPRVGLGRERTEETIATDEALAAGLPSRLAIHSGIYFELTGDDWRVLYRRAGKPVLVERKLGRGSLVLAADSYPLSNEALQKDRAPALLAWLVGPYTRIVFDETHLGVAAQPGVAALARRYGLGGAFGTLLLLAALFVWRRMAGFVPPVDEADDARFAYHPAAGLEALLRRAVPSTNLGAVCATEWAATARESDRRRVDDALAGLPANASPVLRYNAAVRALKRH